MSMATVVDRGADGFVAGLRRCGIEPTVEHGVVKFEVLATVGARAGQVIPTGVGMEELGGWPAIPPHWVNLPSEITFPKTNSQASSVPGWIKHSRDIKGWGNAKEPAQGWIAHVRAVLAAAA